MKTARPLLASIPLAALLIAAVVVPIVVGRGSFGFHSWPAAPPPRIAVQPVPVVAASSHATSRRTPAAAALVAPIAYVKPAVHSRRQPASPRVSRRRSAPAAPAQPSVRVRRPLASAPGPATAPTPVTPSPQVAARPAPVAPPPVPAVRQLRAVAAAAISAALPTSIHRTERDGGGDGASTAGAAAAGCEHDGR